ncbi:hypothetical protein BOX15_Mlig025722g1 [Macrostomum lignano]|uniref:Uncharacterized protein n=1 Tax=Macrostomum lignano TaxID=282301 RepID=A0A267EE73_9PLAT|nr:hypothetical protein BOX15_Mlig025722g1 [Macrostomum lignano]
MQQQQPDTDDLAEEANGDEFDYEDLEIVDIGEGENDGCLGDDSFESDESEGAEPVPVRQPLEVARDDSVATLSGHASSVFCLAASPDGRLLASGGEDDRALVWRVGADGPHAAATAVDAKLVGVCGGHDDSVVFVSFNRTGTLLATGDLSGQVNVWETSQFGQEVSANPANSSSSAEAQPMWSGEAAELRWGCWHPLVASALLVGTGDGSCWLWQIPSGQCKVIAGGQVDSETTCGLVLPNDPGHALAAHDNGRVRLLDLRAGQAVATSTGSLECDSSVLAIDAAPSSGLAACGTETGDVVCFRAAAPRVPLAVCSLPQVSAEATTTVQASASEATPDASNWSVESVQFCPQQESLLAAGCLAGFAFVFDLQAAGSLRVRLRCSVGAGVVRVLWLPRPATTGPLRLATADVAGRARIWDGLSGQPLLELLGHRDGLLDACWLSGPLPLLATCADKCDCSVKLYRID